MKRKIEILSILAMLAWAWGLAGCGGPEAVSAVPPPTATLQEVKLPFRTLERADLSGTGKYYENQKPKFVIIDGVEGIEALGNTISIEAQAQLHNLDFDSELAIVVFQGLRGVIPTPQSGVEVQRISRKGNTITLHTRFYEPVEGYEVHLMMASPYHLVAIRKEGDMHGEFSFDLCVDGTIESQQTHLLP
jgi:hypothetical protein